MEEEAKVEEEKKEGEENMQTASDAQPPVQQTTAYSVERVCELAGHTETVEFCKFDSTGKWLVTGGMNNFLRVWDVQNNFTLK